MLKTDDGKKAIVGIDDLDTLAGSPGTIVWMQMHRNEREILGNVKFDGKIEEIQSDYQQRRK